ncbi:MAG: ubiquinol-cytochrome c reductase core subunit 1 [Trizodia sp. TS-e1964]|nr:MAG: ubiquinol-cytochrome c reductase core subunit 1 [Trizodia sp. TS-e1964]
MKSPLLLSLGGRQCAYAARRRAHPSRGRALASTALESLKYQMSEVDGIKVASRDLPSCTSKLEIIVRAGTRQEMFPGLSSALSRYAYKKTESRSALRIAREVELLGAEIFCRHKREHIGMGAEFLRPDLPYFTELLGEVLTKTKYTAPEFLEEILPSLRHLQPSESKVLAADAVHALAFHRGLGEPLFCTFSGPTSKYLNEDSIAKFASIAYCKQNIRVIANGVNKDELHKWLKGFFADIPVAPPAEAPKLNFAPSRYYGGEERIAFARSNTMIIGFPGSSLPTSGESYKPELAVLASLLGGQPSVKWGSSFSLLSRTHINVPNIRIATHNASYTDAGLFYVRITGSAEGIKDGSAEVVKVLNRIAEGKCDDNDVAKAVAQARFSIYEASQNINGGLEAAGGMLFEGGTVLGIEDITNGIKAVTPEHIKEAAKKLLSAKASVATVGDLHVLPFAEDIGLKV